MHSVQSPCINRSVIRQCTSAGRSASRSCQRLRMLEIERTNNNLCAFSCVLAWDIHLSCCFSPEKTIVPHSSSHLLLRSIASKRSSREGFSTATEVLVYCLIRRESPRRSLFFEGAFHSIRRQELLFSTQTVLSFARAGMFLSNYSSSLMFKRSCLTVAIALLPEEKRLAPCSTL